MVLKEGNKVSLALYRKYRSRSLSDIVGQDQVTNVLKQALKSGRIAHAYLFTGPRGVGKTSIARILAHEIKVVWFCFVDAQNKQLIYCLYVLIMLYFFLLGVLLQV